MTFEDRLLHALQDMPAAPATPSRRPLLVGTGAVAAVVALTAVLFTTTLGGSPALAVERDGEWITVRLLEVAADPDQVESELRAAGIDAEVVVEPAAPELVGRWTRVAFSVAGPLGEVDGDIVRIPADAREGVEIGLGREARPGEDAMILDACAQPSPMEGTTTQPAPPPPGDMGPAITCRETD